MNSFPTNKGKWQYHPVTGDDELSLFSKKLIKEILFKNEIKVPNL